LRGSESVLVRSLDRERRVSTNRRYHTYRKIGPSLHQPPTAPARLGRMLARSLSAVHHDSMVERAPRRIKTGMWRPSPNPRLIRLFPLPLSTQRATATEREPRGDGTITGTRAPQRVSAPPSSDLADAPLARARASQTSSSGSTFFSCTDETIARCSSEVSRLPSPSPFPFFSLIDLALFFSDLVRLGLGLGLGRVRVRV